MSDLCAEALVEVPFHDVDVLGIAWHGRICRCVGLLRGLRIWLGGGRFTSDADRGAFGRSGVQRHRRRRGDEQHTSGDQGAGPVHRVHPVILGAVESNHLQAIAWLSQPSTGGFTASRLSTRQS